MNEAMTGTSVADFNFSDELPNRWPLLLDGIKREGVTQLTTRLRWGAHESLKNVRDFSTASRLRLERFLKLAHERQLSVELHIGFPSTPDAFPAWTKGTTSSNLVFSSALDPALESLELVQIPALEEDDFRLGFVDFVRDVLNIVSLYCSAEGPVSKVVVDLELYWGSLNAMQSKSYAPSLERRYGSIDNFNTIFGTSFRSFEAASSAQSARLLADRRPWLVAFDYKSFQRDYFIELEKAIRVLESGKEMSGFLRFTRHSTVVPKETPWLVAFDSTLLSETNSRVFPFFPGGFVNRSAITTYRFHSYLETEARKSKIPFCRFGGFDHFPQDVNRPIVVVCGKYLQRKDYDRMEALLKSGGRLVFPSGFPQYDEKMNCYQWPVTSAGKFSAPFISLKHCEGSIVVPAKSLTYGDTFWSELQTLMRTVLENRPEVTV